VGFVAVAVAADAFVHVPCLRVDHRDDSVGRHLARDAPTPLGVAWLDVLAGHQPKQADRLGLVAIQVLPLDRGQHCRCVTDQRAHQLVAGLGVVPGTGRLARVMVVVMGAKDKHGGSRDQPTHPADGPNQLCHRVLGGDRVVQQRGVQRPAVPPSQDPSLGGHRPHRLKDPLRPVRGPKPAAPQGQHRGMKALVGQGQPTGHLPRDVLAKLRGRLPVRPPRQRLQHHDRGHLIGRDRRPTTTRREQVSKQLVREQILAVVGQEGIHRARIDQVAAQGRRVQQLDARGVSCPLHAGSLPHHPPASWDLHDLFAQQAPRRA
jgi:hypothetical protein